METIKLYLSKSSTLMLKKDGESHQVQVKKCFPWSDKNEFLSLRDSDDKELYLVESLNDLDEESNLALCQYLKDIDFVLDIIDVISIKEEIELRRYHVKTQVGERVFQTKLDDWPNELEDSSFLIRDLAGDLYRLKSISILSKEGMKQFTNYVS